MDPIIIYENETFESTELYESSPNRFIGIFIYFMMVFTVIAILGMALFTIDEVAETGGMITKSNDQAYQTEIYISNYDLGKVKTGQDVKIEILAFPSNEYGYYDGKVKDISNEPVTDPNTGMVYYQVTVVCPLEDVKDEKGNKLTLSEGLECKAKIVIGQETLLHYFLKNM